MVNSGTQALRAYPGSDLGKLAFSGLFSAITLCESFGQVAFCEMIVLGYYFCDSVC